MNFIQRNKSIFIFGLVVAAAFLAIIILGWREAGRSPIQLTPFQVQESAEAPEDFIYVPPITDVNQSDGVSEEAFPSTSDSSGSIKTPEQDPVQITQRPAKEVAFLDTGFKPRTYEVHVAQIVRITNSTESQITIQELANKQSDKTPITLNSGEQLEIEMVNTGFWTFKELSSGQTARFYVGEN